MDVLTALIAVLAGWLLGYGQQSWRDRREAQLAARLLMDELFLNKAELTSRRDNLAWTVFRPVSHRIWEAHGALILRVLPPSVMHEIQMAHLAIDYADELSTMISDLRRRARSAPQGAREQVAEVEADLVDKARVAVDEVEERVNLALVQIAPLAFEGPLRVARRHASRAWRVARKQPTGQGSAGRQSSSQ